MDLKAAADELTALSPFTAVFHAQQAAEKAMKRFLVLSIVCALARPASACGGFFCDQGPQPGNPPPPVNQAAEEVLSARHLTLPRSATNVQASIGLWNRC